MTLFKDVREEGLAARSSYHKPILLSLMGAKCRHGKRQHSFKFEAWWIRDEGCKQVVVHGWFEKLYSSNPMVRVQHILKSCSRAL